MALIQKYKFKAIQLNDPKEYPAFPLKFDDNIEIYLYVDAITAAVEAGQVDDKTWPTTLFASRRDMKAFFEAFVYYGEMNRLNDRWHRALGFLAGYWDDEGFITYEDVADKLLERAQDLDKEAKKAAARKK